MKVILNDDDIDWSVELQSSDEVKTNFSISVNIIFCSSDSDPLAMLNTFAREVPYHIISNPVDQVFDVANCVWQ